MRMQHLNREFEAEDRKVYFAWLRKTLIAYGALVLFGMAIVAVQSTMHIANVAEFAATDIPMTGP